MSAIDVIFRYAFFLSDNIMQFLLSPLRALWLITTQGIDDPAGARQAYSTVMRVSKPRHCRLLNHPDVPNLGHCVPVLCT